ncbi:MAG: tape measure protein [Henriciella sp.]|nr:tape measure protein [Henriciella sp.]
MTDVDFQKLITVFEANTRSHDAAMRRIIRQSEASSKQMANSFDRANRRIRQSTQSMAIDVRQILAGAAIGLATREIVGFADAYVDLRNKIAAASQVAGLNARSLEEIQVAARGARTELRDYGDLYARILRSSKGVAESELEVARATELAAKAFRAGGASAQEQAAGVLQLGQALGSGFLQGDELRSIRENAPLLAKAIADAVDVSIGELKKLGAEGQLTSDIVFSAILQGGDDIEQAFAVTIPRASDEARLAFDRLAFKMGEYFDESGRVADISAIVAQAIDFLANNVDGLVDSIIVAGAALVGVLGANAMAAIITGLTRASASVTGFAKAMAVLRASTAFLGGPLAAGIGLVAGALALLLLRGNDVNQAFEQLEATLDRYNSAAQRVDEDQRRLIQLNGDLRDAIENQQDAAAATARVEIAALNRRIEKNRELQQVYAATARVQLAAAENELSQLREPDQFTPEISDIATREELNEYGMFVRDGIGDEEVDRRRQAFQDNLLKDIQDRAIAGEVLTKQEEEILQFVEQRLIKEEEILRLREQVAALDQSAPENDGLGEDFRNLLEPTRDPVSLPADDSAAKKAAADAKKLLAEIEREFQSATETELETIARVRDERLAAIEAAALSDEQRATARSQAEAVYAAELAEITKQQEEDAKRLRQQIQRDHEYEVGLLSQVEDARDYMYGRIAAIAQRDYERRREFIELNIKDEERRAEALIALEEERQEYLRRFDQSTEDIGVLQTDADRDIADREAQFEDDLEQLRDRLQAELDTEQEFADKKRQLEYELQQDIQEIRDEAMLGSITAASKGFQDLATIAESFAGQQSAIYKVLIGISRGFAIAEAGIKIAQATAQVLADPSKVTVEQKIAAAAVIAAQGAVIAKGIASSAQGFREGGYTGSGSPGEEAGTVHRDEFVYDSRTTRNIGPGNLEWVRRNPKSFKEMLSGWRGYRDGGLVGGTPRVVTPVAAGGTSSTQVSMPVTINNQVSDVAGVTTQQNSDGGLDVVIAPLISEGGNPLSDAFERTYGLSRGRGL